LHRAVGLPAQAHLSNRVGMRRHRIRCLEVGSALRADLVVAPHFQVAGGGHGWRVAGRCSAQTETGDREVCCGLG
jgi:hypothetical protein